jgi:hypothetical protein
VVQALLSDNVATFPIPENLAHVKWPGTRPAPFGPARQETDPGRSEARDVLGPGRQPVGRARHDLIRLWPARHGSRPMWPVEHEHGPTRPIRPDSSWPLTHADPTAQNPHAECIKSPASLSNPTSSAPALRSSLSHAALHHLHSPPCRAAAPHCVAPALHSPSCRAKWRLREFRLD